MLQLIVPASWSYIEELHDGKFIISHKVLCLLCLTLKNYTMWEFTLLYVNIFCNICLSLGNKELAVGRVLQNQVINGS